MYDDVALLPVGRFVDVLVREAHSWKRSTRIELPPHASGGFVSLAHRDSIALAGTIDGYVYVYERQEEEWTIRDSLKAWDGAVGLFGIGLVLTDQFAAIGAHRDDTRGQDAGAVYIFERANGSFIPDIKLVAADAQPFDQFGRTIAGEENRLVVHSYSGGSTYVYSLAAGQWSEEARLVDRSDSLRFAHSVSINANRILLGGFQRATLYELDSDTWTLTGTLKPDSAQFASSFGYETALQNDVALMSAPWDDTSVEEEAGYVCLYDLSATGTSAERPPLSRGGIRVESYPNPFTDRVTFEYTLPQPGRVSVRIYNVRGGEIRFLGRGYQSAGTQEVLWDARDDLGRRLPSGVYFVRLEVDGTATVSVITLLR